MRIRHDATLYMTPACGNWTAAGHMPAMTRHPVHPHITQTHTTPTQRHSRAVAQKLSSSRRMPRSLISSALSHPPLPTPPPCHQETPDWLSLEQSPPPVCCRGNCSTRTSSSHRSQDHQSSAPTGLQSCVCVGVCVCVYNVFVSAGARSVGVGACECVRVALC